MLSHKHPAVLVSLAVCLVTSLTACANSQNGKSIEQILAADPRLQDNSATVEADNTRNQETEAIATLPDNFPPAIPLYPNAQLQEVTQPTTPTAGESSAVQLTRWVTTESSNLVTNFYRNELQANNWEILSQPTDQQSGTFEARRDDLRLTVTIGPDSATSTSNSQPTEFVIQYTRNTNQIAEAPEAGDEDFIGPVLPQLPTQPEQTPTSSSESQVFTDFNKAPQELRQYIEDLAALGVLSLEPNNSTKSNQSATETQFQPSKIISRRDYARWLVAANNQIHANSASQQIRRASQTVQPAFQDVPRTDPDFAVIQGLAESGLIPSRLSGDSTAVLFRPNAPLTREQMILWKVPLDTRQALPTASVNAVRDSWGFQDAARIEPRALRAVLADFQNSEQSNIRRVFGYTTLFQPKKPVTRAEAAAALWYFGSQGEGLSAQEALQLKRQQNQPSTTSEPAP